MNILNVNKTFSSQHVIRNLSVSFDTGLSHGLLGANGAGKSTLIKMIMGLVSADEGEIRKSDSTSLLPEIPYLPDNLTAFQMVEHACRTQHTKQTEDLLREVRLKEDAWHNMIRTYSKGMKQRTAIAYALAGCPEWLILDEPMSGLDAMGRKQILDVLAKRQQDGTNILMCSHAVTDLVRLCNQVHIMGNGKVCESITIKDHSMQEVEYLESRLQFWSGEYVMD